MKNKKVMYGLIAAAIVVVGVGIFYGSGNLFKGSLSLSPISSVSSTKPVSLSVNQSLLNTAPTITSLPTNTPIRGGKLNVLSFKVAANSVAVKFDKNKSIFDGSIIVAAGSDSTNGNGGYSFPGLKDCELKTSDATYSAISTQQPEMVVFSIDSSIPAKTTKSFQLFCNVDVQGMNKGSKYYVALNSFFYNGLTYPLSYAYNESIHGPYFNVP